MLTDTVLDRILKRLPGLTIGVLGDLFLDRYLEIDADLTEPSLETGLDAYQVVRVRSYPGAAGTIINNLAALGVKEIVAISGLGDDGEGYELRQGLANLRVVNMEGVHTFTSQEFRTPTYTKPMLHQQGQPPRELNRLDIKNRHALALVDEELILRDLDACLGKLDALLVLDQASEADCGIVTHRVRKRLVELGRCHPDKFILADSRQRIGLFRSVALKPNRAECLSAVQATGECLDLESAASKLAHETERPVFCTLGEGGIMLVDPREEPASLIIGAYPVRGPIDTVGAGDSTSAGIAAAVAAGASFADAAAFGNLVASITIQQIGTTGTAAPAQVRQRWQESRTSLQ